MVFSGVVNFVVQRFGQETVLLLDVMRTRSNQRERTMLGKNFPNYITKQFITHIKLNYKCTCGPLPAFFIVLNRGM